MWHRFGKFRRDALRSTAIQELDKAVLNNKAAEGFCREIQTDIKEAEEQKRRETTFCKSSDQKAAGDFTAVRCPCRNPDKFKIAVLSTLIFAQFRF